MRRHDRASFKEARATENGLLFCLRPRARRLSRMSSRDARCHSASLGFNHTSLCLPIGLNGESYPAKKYALAATSTPSSSSRRANALASRRRRSRRRTRRTRRRRRASPRVRVYEHVRVRGFRDVSLCPVCPVTVVTVPFRTRRFRSRLLERHEERDREVGVAERAVAGRDRDAHGRGRRDRLVSLVRAADVLKQTLEPGGGGVVVARARDSRGGPPRPAG